MLEGCVLVRVVYFCLAQFCPYLCLTSLVLYFLCLETFLVHVHCRFACDGDGSSFRGDVVWEDTHGACAMPALLPLYSQRWRSFFVLGLGVPEHPTGEHALRRLDQLVSSGEDTGTDTLILSYRMSDPSLPSVCPPRPRHLSHPTPSCQGKILESIWSVLLFISDRLAATKEASTVTAGVSTATGAEYSAEMARAAKVL